jgi:tetratricopeptide (TPR) repeat protein
VSTVNQEQFQKVYQAGKEALERGNYQQSVSYLETAHQLVPLSSRKGGEVGIWLITAYQAANRIQDAIALSQKLSRHPHTETRKQSQRLLYILKAPALKRPKEWMVEIPDLGTLPESDPKDRRGSNTVKSASKPKEEEVIDPSLINRKDNGFVWLTLIAILLTLGGLWLFGFG